MTGSPARSTWLDAAQTAELLGVKAATVYAYVSRGLLHPRRPEHAGGGRHSEFDRREVERLAARSRRGGRAGALDVLVESDLTLLDPAGAMYYRGAPVADLARTLRFEQVAAHLWDVPAATQPWHPPAEPLAAARAAAAQLPPAATAVDRVRLATAVLAPFDPDRSDRSLGHVTAIGTHLVAAGVDVQQTRTAAVDGSIAARLWSVVADHLPSQDELSTTDAALTVLADHELAASTFAARVAAGVRSDPYLVVLTGLSTLSGSLHGRTSGPARAMLEDAAATDDVTGAVARATRGGSLDGFGHKVYRGPDPRADVLLDLVARLAPDRWPVVDRVLEEGVRASGREPNVDAGLAAFEFACRLAPGSGELVFALARIVGIIGHALEEYPHALRFRPRAVYTGLSPGSPDVLVGTSADRAAPGTATGGCGPT